MVIEIGVKYKFTAEDLKVIQTAKAKNKHKRIDKRLTVLEMSAQGVARAEISHITGYHIDYIPKLISQYRDGFRNEIFTTLDKVVDRLCDSINAFSKNMIMSIAGRD